MQNNILQKTSESPLYVQLMTRLKNDISCGIYESGSRIPSEQELCDHYGVSRVTVRKAMLDLVQEGLLVRRQGKGTFVAEERMQRDLHQITSFTEACRISGHEPSTKVLSLQWDNITKEEVSKLLLPEGSRMLEITRLRYADNIPVTLEVNRFPALYSFLQFGDLSLSLYDLLVEKGYTPSDCEHLISLGHATPQASRYLQCNVGEALLVLDEVIFNQHHEPMYCGRQWIRGDKFTFRI